MNKNNLKIVLLSLIIILIGYTIISILFTSSAFGLVLLLDYFRNGLIENIIIGIILILVGIFFYISMIKEKPKRKEYFELKIKKNKNKIILFFENPTISGLSLNDICNLNKIISIFTKIIKKLECNNYENRGKINRLKNISNIVKKIIYNWDSEPTFFLKNKKKLIELSFYHDEGYFFIINGKDNIKKIEKILKSYNL